MAADAESVSTRGVSTRGLGWGSRLAERGWVPDFAIRRVIRRLCAERYPGGCEWLVTQVRLARP